jgi:quinolinate synthase
MQITSEAKTLLLEELKKNYASCILVREIQSCCGNQLNFSLAKTKNDAKIIFIDGVPFMMEADIKLKTEKVTIKAENRQLLIQDESESKCDCA